MVTLTHFLEGNPLPPHRLLFSAIFAMYYVGTYVQPLKKDLLSKNGIL